MENASKALIIAGAILLAIIIISLGLMVVNNARNQMGGANLSKEEIQAFNAQWDNYCGGNKSAAEIRSLLSTLISSNAAEESSGTNRIVKVKYDANLFGTNAEVDNAKPTTVPSIQATKTYTVTPTYANGLITLLTIT